MRSRRRDGAAHQSRRRWILRGVPRGRLSAAGARVLRSARRRGAARLSVLGRRSHRSSGQWRPDHAARARPGAGRPDRRAVVARRSRPHQADLLPAGRGRLSRRSAASKPKAGTQSRSFDATGLADCARRRRLRRGGAALRAHRTCLPPSHAGTPVAMCRTGCAAPALVVTLHGMHYTGYIFNDYARMLAILQLDGDADSGRARAGVPGVVGRALLLGLSARMPRPAAWAARPASVHSSTRGRRSASG